MGLLLLPGLSEKWEPRCRAPTSPAAKHCEKRHQTRMCRKTFAVSRRNSDPFDKQGNPCPPRCTSSPARSGRRWRATGAPGVGASRAGASVGRWQSAPAVGVHLHGIVGQAKLARDGECLRGEGLRSDSVASIPADRQPVTAQTASAWPAPGGTVIRGGMATLPARARPAEPLRRRLALAQQQRRRTVVHARRRCPG